MSHLQNKSQQALRSLSLTTLLFLVHLGSTGFAQVQCEAIFRSGSMPTRDSRFTDLSPLPLETPEVVAALNSRFDGKPLGSARIVWDQMEAVMKILASAIGKDPNMQLPADNFTYLRHRIAEAITRNFLSSHPGAQITPETFRFKVLEVKSGTGNSQVSDYDLKVEFWMNGKIENSYRLVIALASKQFTDKPKNIDTSLWGYILELANFKKVSPNLYNKPEEDMFFIRGVNELLWEMDLDTQKNLLARNGFSWTRGTTGIKIPSVSDHSLAPRSTKTIKVYGGMNRGQTPAPRIDDSNITDRIRSFLNLSIPERIRWIEREIDKLSNPIGVRSDFIELKLNPIEYAGADFLVTYEIPIDAAIFGTSGLTSDRFQKYTVLVPFAVAKEWIVKIEEVATDKVLFEKKER